MQTAELPSFPVALNTASKGKEKIEGQYSHLPTATHPHLWA